MNQTNQSDEEQLFVVQEFRNGFSSMKDRNIVLYGIGKNTEAVINEAKDFKIVGLMDSKTTGERIYGQKVLDEEEAAVFHPVIVIIARETVVDIIYERIRHLQTERGIPIYNFRGVLLGQEKAGFDNRSLEYWTHTEKELREKIRAHAVVSFDIFDTLLMRRVLEPEDVFVMVERELQVAGGMGDSSFVRMRKRAEQSCQGVPDIHEIYTRMKDLFGLEDALLEKWKAAEFNMEKRCLTVRHKMLELFEYAVNCGKTVYLVSDMYYPTDQMEELLSMFGIAGYQELIISCDRKKTKKDGSLFRCLIRRAGSRDILHIGDNRRDDIRQAEKEGLDAFHIYSGYELLMASDMQKTASHLDGMEKRAVLGLVISHYFNDPFVLHERKGGLSVRSMEELGMNFIAPMLVEFIQWMSRRAEEIDREGGVTVLFPSRDGYLIKQLYDAFAAVRKLPAGIYFKASRRAVSVASVTCAEHIREIIRRPFTGSMKDLLQRRFGVEIEDRNVAFHNVRQMEGVELEGHVLRYRGQILSEAGVERERYLDYLARHGIGKGKRYLLFDFVAGGTVQHYLSRLLEANIRGLYFANSHPFKAQDGDRIETAYGNFSPYCADSALARYYLILECILTDPDPTFRCIGEDGEAEFEAGTNESYVFMKSIHTAVMDYAKEYLSLYGGWDSWEPQLRFSDEILGYLFKKPTLVKKEIKELFTNDDAYDGMEMSRIWP